MKYTQLLQHQEVQMKLLIQCSHSEPSVGENAEKYEKKMRVNQDITKNRSVIKIIE